MTAAALPRAFASVLTRQQDVFHVRQAFDAGLTRGFLRNQLAADRWQRVGFGVLAAHNGPLGGEGRLWLAILQAGPGALLSHATAAHLQGLLADPPGAIHLAVPAPRAPRVGRGVVVHRTRRPLRAASGRRLPQTAVVETVLDVAASAERANAVIAVVTRSLQQRLTTRAQLSAALAERERSRWRGLLEELFAEADGVESALEWHFVRDVLRAHGLPPGTRQHVVRRGGRIVRRDIVIPEFGVVVELDGRLGHEGDGVLRDMRRDNAAAAAGEIVLRYGWADVVGRPCEVARQIAQVLRARGWPGRPTCCPACR